MDGLPLLVGMALEMGRGGGSSFSFCIKYVVEWFSMKLGWGGIVSQCLRAATYDEWQHRSNI
jgi:hypothetical protein